jgi:hypothetical protein
MYGCTAATLEARGLEEMKNIYTATPHLWVRLSAIIVSISACTAAGEKCAESGDVYEIYCNEIASGSNVKLKVVENLKAKQLKENKEAIQWLEQSIFLDKLSLEQMTTRSACNTEHVRNVLVKMQAYTFSVEN